MIRTISVIAVAAILLGYNWELGRRKEQASAYISAEGLEEQPDTAAKYKDGIYFGEAEGFGGSISLEVEISGGKLTDIRILSAEDEDRAYFTMAQDIIPEIIDTQSTQVDTVSGATFSSTGIRDAVEQALLGAAEDEKEE